MPNHRFVSAANGHGVFILHRSARLFWNCGGEIQCILGALRRLCGHHVAVDSRPCSLRKQKACEWYELEDFQLDRGTSGFLFAIDLDICIDFSILSGNDHWYQQKGRRTDDHDLLRLFFLCTGLWQSQQAFGLGAGSGSNCFLWYLSITDWRCGFAYAVSGGRWLCGCGSGLCWCISWNDRKCGFGSGLSLLNCASFLDCDPTK